MRALVLGLCLASLCGTAFAQGLRQPRQSRAEREVQEINRNLQRQQRNLGVQQQNQFEVNQLRQELNRQQNFPPVIGPSSPRGCPPGSIGC
jgi:hypothetical protein